MQFYREKTRFQLTLVFSGILSSIIILYSLFPEESLRLVQGEKTSYQPVMERQALAQILTKALDYVDYSNFCAKPIKQDIPVSFRNQQISLESYDQFRQSASFRLAQDAVRRCHDRKNKKLHFCYTVFEHSQEKLSFTNSRQALLEIQFTFRDAMRKKEISCNEAILNQNSQMTAYYSLYWQDQTQKSRSPYFRMTGGISQRLRRFKSL